MIDLERWTCVRAPLPSVMSGTSNSGSDETPAVFQHRRGRLLVYERRQYPEARPPVNERRLSAMSPTVRTEDLIDAQEVADLLGLAQRNSVTTYLRRYPEMP